MRKLHIDIETFSSVDIMTTGAYKYMESIDFEVLMIAWAIDEMPTQIIDLAQGENLPPTFIEALLNPDIEKHAHNAAFERNAFKTIGYNIPIEQWRCSAIKAAYCGLPLSLDKVSKAMDLQEKAKDANGKNLIKYFSIPIKPTKVNGMRTRNFPHHNLEKWEKFKQYCIQDVEAEREIDKRLEKYIIPDFERKIYVLDQQINDRGILIDLEMAQNAVNIDSENSIILANRIKELTGVDNPNSAAQIKKWLGEATGKKINSLAKEFMPKLIEESESAVVSEVLNLRQKSSKTSVKKYTAMLDCACDDLRARGLLQFYGANRTGRWAGRLIQLQNLPRNYLSDLSLARQIVKDNDNDLMTMSFDDVADTLSQLIRTAFIPEPGNIFGVSDFSAIEARVIAWLAGEKWRQEVFATHGKIYEASASKMFGVPLETVTKGSDLRYKGKVAELALGYQGAVGAMKRMGGEAMGLSEDEMSSIVKKWRLANKNIVKLWKEVEGNVLRAFKSKSLIETKFFNYEYDGDVLTIQLPSGRKLFYQKPSKVVGSYGQESITYYGLNQEIKQWAKIDSYGGKFVENIVQAVARDLLAEAMINLAKEGFDIVMHVHDEIVCELNINTAKEDLKQMENIMGIVPKWANGLILTADGYLTEFYKKD